MKADGVREHCLLDGDCPNVCVAFLFLGVACGEGCPMWDWEAMRDAD